MEILDEKRKEVARLKKTGLPQIKAMDRLEVRDFKGAVSSDKGTGLIAEIKFASPSAGVIRDRSDPVAIGSVYEDAGAAAISLLTDEKFFGGSLENLVPLKKGVSLPILRKDFIVDEIQVRESSLFGADAILLIARILSWQQLKELLATAKDSGLAVLTEIHDKGDLDKSVEAGADIIGINNRDLDTFEVDIRTTLELAPLVPKACILVTESGINTGEDIRLLKKCGINAALVGTSIMKSSEPKEKIKELVEAGRNDNTVS
ncbi:MAG: indole-3-glycerol phosphate synthase TrpC [Desulfobacterales bacterium]|nr:indole-3-glycerol phosphate synthase TrpC [Desulfobacterales bacterium]